ncbi:4789_t:CDS:1, partial [Racocetra persica]
NQNLIDNILGDSLEESDNKDDNKEVIKEKTDLFYTPSFNFLPFQHNHLLHESQLNLTKDLELNISSYNIFLKFFSIYQIETIVKNTNIYAYVYGAKKGNNTIGENRSWTELTIQELKI